MAVAVMAMAKVRPYRRELAVAALVVAASLAPASAAEASEASHGDCADSVAEGRRLAGTAWWCKEWERDSVQVAASLPMLVAAIAFEAVFHYVQHRSQRTYVYGDTLMSDAEIEAKRHAQVFGKPLREVLWQSLGGELMALGFLALLVWSLNQADFFDLLARFEFKGARTPTDASDYLHLAEAVHIQLFLGMVLYFAFAYRVVQGCCTYSLRLEECRNQWLQQLQGRSDKADEPDSPQLQNFKSWRRHFLQHGVAEIMPWKRTRPGAFANVLASMGLDPLQPVTEDELREAFQGCFSFATYLAFAVRESCLSIIHLSWVDILFVAAIKLILFCLYRFMHWSANGIAPAFVVAVVIGIIVVYGLTERLKANYLDADCRYKPSKTCGLSVLHRKVNLRRVISSAYQCMLFFVCFSFAGNLISKDFYMQLGHIDPWSLVLVLSYFLFVALLFFVLPRAVPNFAVVMALPPFFNRANQDLLIRVLTAGGAQGACWAPYVDSRNERMVRARGRLELLHAVRDLVEDSRAMPDSAPEPKPFNFPLPGDQRKILSIIAAQETSQVQPRSPEEQVVEDLFEMLTEWRRIQAVPSGASAQEERDPQRVASRLSHLHNALQQGKAAIRREYTHSMSRFGSDGDAEASEARAPFPAPLLANAASPSLDGDGLSLAPVVEASDSREAAEVGEDCSRFAGADAAAAAGDSDAAALLAPPAESPTATPADVDEVFVVDIPAPDAALERQEAVSRRKTMANKIAAAPADDAVVEVPVTVPEVAVAARRKPTAEPMSLGLPQLRSVGGQEEGVAGVIPGVGSVGSSPKRRVARKGPRKSSRMEP